MKFARKDAPDTNPNIAPLLDVVLLLLIFFMVTTSFAAHQIPLDLPNADAPTLQDKEATVVTINANGIYSVDDQVLSESELATRLESVAATERPLEIRADAATPHGNVVRVLDLANQLDLTQIGIRVEAVPTAPDAD